ncbi:MAG: hypothetical protein Fur0039_02320 [Rhodocyclaceae bacterium]
MSREDQAAGLRRMLGPRALRSFAMIGADPGLSAGVAARLAAALAACGERVTVIDEHQGEHGVAGAFGCATRRDLAQVLSADASLEETLLAPLPRVRILPAARAACRVGGRRGGAPLAKLLHELSTASDVLVVHAARDPKRGVCAAALAPQRRILCVATDPAGITAAYRLLKGLAGEIAFGEMQALMAGGSSIAAARAAFENLRALAGERLGIALDWLAWVSAQALGHPWAGGAGSAWRELTGALACAPRPKALGRGPLADVPGLARVARAAGRSQRSTRAEI